MAFDLAVTYTLQKIEGRLFFIYRGNKYATKAQMVQEILKDHKSVNQNKILLLNAGVLRTNPEALNSLGLFYESPFTNAPGRQIGQVIVIEGFIKGRTSYMCLNKIFSNFQKAKIYAYLMTIKFFFTPQKQSQIKLPDSMNILKHVRGFGISNIIWKEVWGNCYFYKCFATRNYMELKNKLLNELNLYRYEHQVPPVHFSSRMNNVAETNLDSLMYRNRQINSQLSRNFVKVPYYSAPLIFKRWYEEYKYYKYNTKSAVKGTEHFSSMVWKDVKYVGFAIKEMDNVIYFYCAFYPQPNIPEQFKSNVLKRKSNIF